MELKNSTAKFSAKGSLLSEIIPEVDQIYSSLINRCAESESEAETELIRSLIDQIDRVLNLEKMKKDPIKATATFLDPRFKDLYFDETLLCSIGNFIRATEW